jgi:hypothetical protein
VFHSFGRASLQFRKLQDARLCNNVKRVNRTEMCKPRGLPDLEAGSDFECDSRVISDDKCMEVALELNTFTYDDLLNVLPQVDTDFSIRRIVVKILQVDIETDTIGKEIDKFLTSRLWWYVTKEPFHWNKHMHRIVVLDRVTHGFEPSLQELSALQYPPTEVSCAESALLVNHNDFTMQAGWFSMLNAYFIVHGEMPYGITHMYVSEKNSPDESTSFVSAMDCPNLVNKWECAFLPTTNCTPPSALTKCNPPLCQINRLRDTRWATLVYSAATADAGLVPPDSTAYAQLRERSAKPTPGNVALVAAAAASADTPAPSVRYLKPYNSSAAPFHSMMFFSPEQYTYNFLLRPNAFYRMRIEEEIKRFRADHSFATSDRCVAAQIRRGDRTLPGMNVTEYCRQSNYANSDFGCATVPFASVTLRHVVESAATLVEPSVRTLFVTTDDEEWLDQQREVLRSTHPEWTVLNLHAPHHRYRPPAATAAAATAEGSASSSVSSGGAIAIAAQAAGGKGSSAAASAPPDEYEYMRLGAGTASGVLLHGSIELSRQCEAFVGHFGCGGTLMVYRAMCAHHDSWEYVCPPAFDVRSIPELILHP